MIKILNKDTCPAHFTSPSLQTTELGTAAGNEKLYVNIDYVQPGAKSTKYHSHSLQEEFFLILKGSGILRMNDETAPVQAGDFVAKPAGRGIAHQFINDGTEVLEILDCGTKEANDVVNYPDEPVRGKDWKSDPN